MATRSPRMQGLLGLWEAHRELSTLEWLECQQILVAAAQRFVVAAIFGLTAWLALNGAVVIAFREQPLEAALAIVVVNALGAGIAAWQAIRLLRFPFFAVTRREATQDVRALFKVTS